MKFFFVNEQQERTLEYGWLEDDNFLLGPFRLPSVRFVVLLASGSCNPLKGDFKPF